MIRTEHPEANLSLIQSWTLLISSLVAPECPSLYVRNRTRCLFSSWAVKEGEDIVRVFLNGQSFYQLYHSALSALLLLLYKVESLTIWSAKRFPWSQTEVLGNMDGKKRIRIRGRGRSGQREGGYKIYFRLSCFLWPQGLLKNWEARLVVQHLADTLSDNMDNMVQVWLWQQPPDGLVAPFEYRIVMAKAQPGKLKLSWKQLSLSSANYNFPLGQKPICLVFNTTKFPLSCWQNGSGLCLKSCNENNFS